VSRGEQTSLRAIGENTLHRSSSTNVASLWLSQSLHAKPILSFTLRAVSAPLNPAYSQSEISFYLKDTQSSVLLIASSSGAEPATIKAGKECGVKVVTVTPEGKTGVRLNVVYEPEAGKGKTLGVVANENQGDGTGKVLEGDVALVLHTSGTTGRPKGEQGVALGIRPHRLTLGSQRFPLLISTC
jgi:non-ribosomal peptide synthetase component F